MGKGNIMKVDYNKIYEILANRRCNYIDAGTLAVLMDVERIYGATMTKLVRDGYLETCSCKGMYRIVR